MFRHPTGGVQLPAGSVESGEEPENAALRELLEETGIERVEELRRLRVLAVELERVIFQARVARDDRASWQHFADGHWLEIFWQPLRPKPVLVGPQQICLDSVYPQLLSEPLVADRTRANQHAATGHLATGS